GPRAALGRRPAGRWLAVEVVGLLLAVIVSERGEPPAPQAVSGLVITGVAAIVNVCAFDVPPHGVTTVIEAVPAVAIREAGTVAVSCVVETNVVVSAVPLHCTVEPDTKLVPFTVKANCGPPAVA